MTLHHVPMRHSHCKTSHRLFQSNLKLHCKKHPFTSPPRSPSIPRLHHRITTLNSTTTNSSRTTSTTSTWPTQEARQASFDTTPPSSNQPTTISGTLPPWLNGIYIRNGPGTYENGSPEGMLHMFDGYAMIVKLDIHGNDNAVSVSHQYIESSSYSYYKSKGKMKWREFATPIPYYDDNDDSNDSNDNDSNTNTTTTTNNKNKPRTVSQMFNKFLEITQMSLGALGLTQGVTDNASVNILPITYNNTRHYIAVTETVAGTFAIDPSTLRTLGRVSYIDSLRGELTTAHPTIYDNGDLVNILSDPVGGFTIYRQRHNSGDSGSDSDSSMNNNNNKNTSLSSSTTTTHDDTTTTNTNTTNTTNTTPSIYRESIATIPHHRPLSPAWIHNFPSSTNYAIIPETPAYFNLPSLMLGNTTDHIFLDWIPTDGSRIHVVRLSDGNITTFHVQDPFFVFHWVNAFESEDGRYLYIDGAVYNDLDIVNHLYLDSVKRGCDEGRELPVSSLRRMKLDLTMIDSGNSGSSSSSGGDISVTTNNDTNNKDNTTTNTNTNTNTTNNSNSNSNIVWEELMDSAQSHGHFIEFPCVHPLYKGKQYRYTWGTCAVRPTNVNNAIGKFDTKERKCIVWNEPGSIVGEPTFVPNPHSNSGDEDDGVVLSLIMQSDGTSALLVLDGKTMVEVARARVGYGITNGFHGTFVFE